MAVVKAQLTLARVRHLITRWDLQRRGISDQTEEPIKDRSVIDAIYVLEQIARDAPELAAEATELARKTEMRLNSPADQRPVED